MTEKSNDNSKSILGFGLIGVGVLVAISRFTNFDIGESLWPLFIIVPGVAMLLASASVSSGGKWLSVAGATTTITGLLLAYQNTFDHYESWAYAWALVGPVGIGAGWIVYGLKHQDTELVAAGRRQVNRGAALFLAGAVFFELILNISGRGITGLLHNPIVLPVILIAAGLFFLMWHRRSNT